MAIQTNKSATPFKVRSNETNPQTHNRCGRFYHTNDRWFFKTREGFDYGPFTSKTECKYAYEEFIEVVSNQVELGGTAIDFQDAESNWKVPNISFN